MDVTDVVILMLLISILFLCGFGLLIYFMNIQHQKNIINNQLDLIQAKQLEESKSPKLPEINSMPINIPTRGMEQFRQLGILTSQNDNKRVLPLYGRRTYVGSHKWNYYTSTDGYNSFQVSVVNKNKDCSEEYGCDEINSHDDIHIPAYNESFKALMYRNTGPKYIPYIT